MWEESETLQYCGCDIINNNEGISLKQTEYINKQKPITLTPTRKSDVNSPLTQKSPTQLTGLPNPAVPALGKRDRPATTRTSSAPRSFGADIHHGHPIVGKKKEAGSTSALDGSSPVHYRRESSGGRVPAQEGGHSTFNPSGDGTRRSSSLCPERCSPFHREYIPIEPDLQECLSLAVRFPDWLNHHRQQLMAFWEEQAVKLLPDTDRVLQSVSDPHLRRLLRGQEDSAPLQLGSCFHITLWNKLMKEAKSIDTDLVDQMLHGMSIVGSIARSRRWPAVSTEPDISMADLKGGPGIFRPKFTGMS